MRCCATPRPVLQRTVFTVQNTEVDTFSSEPLLNFIVVEKLLLLLIKILLFMFMHCSFSESSVANIVELARNVMLASS